MSTTPEQIASTVVGVFRITIEREEYLAGHYDGQEIVGRQFFVAVTNWKTGQRWRHRSCMLTEIVDQTGERVIVQSVANALRRIERLHTNVARHLRLGGRLDSTHWDHDPATVA